MNPRAHRKEYFRSCSRPDCRICHPRPEPEQQESFAGLLLAAAGLVLLAIALVVILPLMPGVP